MRCILLFIFFIVSLGSFGQTGNFRSIASGNWSTAATWERDADQNGVYEENPSSVAPNSLSNLIDIQNGDIVTLTTNETINGVLSILSGGTLRMQSAGGPTADRLTIAASGTLNNSGTFQILSGPIKRVRVFGTFNNSGSLTGLFAINRVFFEADALYDHQYTTTNGTIPIATWDSNSTCQISGFTTNSTAPINLNQSFGNFTYNCVNQQVEVDLAGSLQTINGNLNLTSSGFIGTFLDRSNSSTSISVGGDLDVDDFFYITESGSNVALLVSGAAIFDNANAFFVLNSVSGSSNLDIDGSLTMDNGAFIDMSFFGAGSSTVNLAGDMSLANFSSISTGFGSGTYTILFDGISAQVITASVDEKFDGVDIDIASNAIVSVSGDNVLGTAGNFTLNNLSTLEVGSTAVGGAIQTSAAGNLQIDGLRTYNSGSIVRYNGTSAQFIGTAHPANSNTIIDNTNGVTLASDVSIGGALNLASGNISLGANTLTLGGAVSGTGAFQVASSSNLTLNGTGSFTLPFVSGAPEINNLTVNSTGAIVDLEDDLTVSGILALIDGDLDFTGQTLNLSGTISGTGSFVSDGLSTLNITGSGSLGGTISFSNSGNTLGSFVLNRVSTGSAAIGSTLNVSTALNLTAGEFDNSSGTLTMGNGSTLTINSNASFTGNNPDTNIGETYNVVYTGNTHTTGAEIPIAANTDALGDLTISASSVILDQPLTANGNFSLTSGSFAIATNDLTVRGDLSRSTGTSITPYTGEIVFDGTSVVTGEPDFVNLRLTSGSMLTFPSDNINISGTLQFISGSTFNANNGTITFNGSTSQSISAGGATLNNITIDKTGGDVTFSTALNLAGELTFASTTDLATGNGLALLSTSDGGSGNASIGAIPSGATVTGNITVQRFMSAGENPLFRYISSPVTNATVADWQDDFLISGTWTGADGISTDASMFIYDETTLGDRNQGYMAYPDQTTGAATDLLTPGVGFAAFVRSGSQEVIEVNGPINQGDFPTNISFTSDQGLTEDGWNLIGNPYPASISWDNIVTRTGGGTGVSETVYITDNGSGTISYRMWNGSVGDVTFAGNIAQGQAFWVKAVSSSPILTLFETDKTSATGSFYRTYEEAPQVLEIVVRGSTNYDYTAILLKEGSTSAYDPIPDGLKFLNEKINLYTKASSGEELGINTLSDFGCSNQFDLYLTDVDEGTYTFEFDKIESFSDEFEIKLIDNFTDSEFLLEEGFNYQFEVTSDIASYGADRFDITFNASEPDLELSVLSENTCVGNGSVITIQNSEVGVGYSALIDGTVVSDTLMGNGSDLVIQISEEDLSLESNIIDIRAATSVCGDFELNALVDVIKSEAVEITDLGDGLLSSSYVSGNQWYFNDQLIEGAVNQTYLVTESGVYSVEVQFGSCITRAQIEQSITSLELEQNGIEIYPNPTKDVVNFRFQDLGFRNIEIRDLSGKLFKSELINEKSHTMNVSSFESGIYIIHLDMGDRTLVYKISIQ